MKLTTHHTPRVAPLIPYPPARSSRFAAPDVAPPGSFTAWRAGCQCPRILNGWGLGHASSVVARPAYVIAADCPLHASPDVTSHAVRAA